ncbi:MAG: metal-dependent transcriptional regulator [Armatimonadetes bacterium]|nr:metal-dependent transcriptional regulator [Armatimonadota bacterium]
MPSESVEEYIEAIYRIGGETGMVNTCDLAEQLGVTPPSVTTMLRRLSRDGLVKHVPYRGITLTTRGREMAAAMIRRHRLSERILTDVFGIPWERVHNAACKLEHVITGEIEDRAYQVLGEPERCPHGHLLEGSEDVALLLLSEVPEGERVVVVKLAEEGGEFLQTAAEIGLVPLAEVEVTSLTDGKMILDICGQRREIGADVASLVWVAAQSEPANR